MWGIGGVILIGFLLIAATIGITATVDAIGTFISSAGLNVIDGIHIHKTLFGWIFIFIGVLLIHYRQGELTWLKVLMILAGVIIVVYDVAVWSVYLPITLEG